MFSNFNGIDAFLSACISIVGTLALKLNEYWNFQKEKKRKGKTS